MTTDNPYNLPPCSGCGKPLLILLDSQDTGGEHEGLCTWCIAEKKKHLKVFLDDKRPAYKDWTLAWSYERAIQLLESGEVAVISLDHDLGTKKTGYDVVCWIERNVFHNVKGFSPPKMYCHSANCPGHDKIKAAIERIEKEWTRQHGERRSTN
jgi:hypothetical protein